MRAYLTLALMFSVSPPLLAAEAARGVALESEAAMNPLVPESRGAIVPGFRSRMAFVRAVRDTTKWDFASTLDNADWVVAQVTPPAAVTLWNATRETVRQSQTNTNARTTATLEKIESGTLEGLAEGAPVVWVKVGAYEVLMPLWETKDGKSQASHSGSFFFDNWATVVENGKYAIVGSVGYDPEILEEYSPFTRPPAASQTRNLVIYRLPQVERKVHFDGNKITVEMVPLVSFYGPVEKDYPSQQAFLLSEDTLSHVLPARNFYLKNREMFLVKEAARNRARLFKLLRSHNPFLFAAAIRTLSKASLVESDFVSKQLLGMNRFQQGVFVFSVLRNSSERQEIILAEAMRKTIGQAKSSAQLEGIFTGMLCAAQSRERVTRDRGWPPVRRVLYFRPLRDALTKKLKDLGVRNQTDQYMQDVLTRPEFREIVGALPNGD